MTYSKRNIMLNAWSIRRTDNVSMSIALKAAWALEKVMADADRQASEINWNTRVVVNTWAKGGHSRTYVSIRIYTNAWNCKRERKLGYVNNLTGEFIAA